MRKESFLFSVVLLIIMISVSCAPAIRVRDPESQKRAMEALDTEMRNRNWMRALDIVNELIAYSPDDCFLYSQRLVIYSGINESDKLYNDIVQNYEKCLRHSEYLETAYNFLKKYDDPQIMYRVSKELFEITGDAEYEEKMMDSLNKYSVNLYRNAVEYRNENNIHEAVDILYDIIDMNPDFKFSYRLLAVIYNEMHEYEKSLEIFDALFEIDDKNETDLELYASILYKTGREYDAYNVYKKILDLYPFNRTAQKKLEELRVKIDKNHIVRNIIDNAEYYGFVSLDQLSALIYFYLYDHINHIDEQYKIIIDIDDNPFSEYIEYLVFRGILPINQRRMFEPSKPVTRGNLSSAFYNILNNLTDIQKILSEDSSLKYRDINEYHIYFDIIRIIDYYSLIDPEKDNEFDITIRMGIRDIIDSIERLKNLLINKEIN